MARHTSSWKHTERAYAKLLGGKRNHFEDEDIAHPLFSVEVKHRSKQNYPARLRDWFEQARRNAKPGKITMLAIHLAGEVRGNDLVVFRLSDIEDLLGQFKKGSTNE